MPPPPPGARHSFSHRSSGPPVHFTHQTLTISSFGYLFWRNKRHCYPFYYSKKKPARGFELTPREQAGQWSAIHVALTTTPRAFDSSNVVLTNIYLGLNHPRWNRCMQTSTRGLWLAVCKWVSYWGPELRWDKEFSPRGTNLTWSMCQRMWLWVIILYVCAWARVDVWSRVRVNMYMFHVRACGTIKV